MLTEHEKKLVLDNVENVRLTIKDHIYEKFVMSLDGKDWPGAAVSRSRGVDIEKYNSDCEYYYKVAELVRQSFRDVAEFLGYEDRFAYDDRCFRNPEEVKARIRECCSNLSCVSQS